MQTLASFSPCRLYRYRLSRIWDATVWKQLIVIGLNPSTADETVDDPTIRRCIGFAKRERCGELLMLNLFALRSTDPQNLLNHPSPISERRFPGHNDFIIAHATRTTELLEKLVVCAWGAHPMATDRGARVRESFRARKIPVHHLGLTKSGHPRHPLYLPSITPIEVWE